jgi:hypothetical protein
MALKSAVVGQWKQLGCCSSALHVGKAPYSTREQTSLPLPLLYMDRKPSLLSPRHSGRRGCKRRRSGEPAGKRRLSSLKARGTEQVWGKMRAIFSFGVCKHENAPHQAGEYTRIQTTIRSQKLLTS